MDKSSNYNTTNDLTLLLWSHCSGCTEAECYNGEEEKEECLKEDAVGVHVGLFPCSQCTCEISMVHFEGEGEA